jgi:hypothetical protein
MMAFFTQSKLTHGKSRAMSDNRSMKHVMLVLLMGALSGCASMQSKWKDIEPGQSKEDAISIMGKPDGYSKAASNGANVLVWQMDEFSICAARLDSANKVDAKVCQDNAEARAQAHAAKAAAWQAAMASQQRPLFVPMQSQQSPRPTRTDCNSTYGGGFSCTSQPTGVDTSIYQQR